MAIVKNLGRPKTENKAQEWRDKVIKEAKSWINTPHVHYTLQKGIGADCGLFIIGVYSNIGLINKEMPEYYPEDWAFHKPIGDMFESIVQRYCKEVTKEEIKSGDLILYQFGKCLSHGSILLPDNYIIHSEKPIGVTVSNRETNMWYSREKKYYTYND